MAFLHCGFLIPCSFPSVSAANLTSDKFYNFQPEFKFRSATALNVGYRDVKEAKEVNSQTFLSAISGATNDPNFSQGLMEECLYLLNCCNNEKTHVLDAKQIHARIVKSGISDSNTLIGNKLAILYSRNLSILDDARRLFEEIPERTVPAYAALIRSYYRSQKWEDIISVFRLMVHEGMQPDKFLLPTIFKACSALKDLRIGRTVHGYIIRKNLEWDVFVGNALIHMYAKCGNLKSSRGIFDTMPVRDVVSWTSLVSAFMDAGYLDEAKDIFELMQFNGVKPDLISWNALVSGFAQNGDIDMALELLEEMRAEGLKPGISSWNGIISGCVQNEYFEYALNMFNKMLFSSEDPNAITIASVLAACAGVGDLDLGNLVHAYALKCEIQENIFVGGSLIEMYTKCGRNDYAERVFVEIENKNTAVCNGLISSYVNEGKMKEAMELFRLMHTYGSKPDIITFNTLLSGYARNGQKDEVFELLSEMCRVGLNPNVISLNVLISGFQQSGLSREALKLFRVMQSPPNVMVDTNSAKSNAHFPLEVLNFFIEPNPVTMTGSLAACADLNSLHLGKEIHGHILRNGYESNVFVSSTLVDMYAKCHDMDSAKKVFCRIMDRNTVSWNVLMAGYNNHKEPEEALKLFLIMLEDGLSPSFITLVILLSSCSDIAVLRLGRELHGYIVKCGFDESTITLSGALIDMYSKCGSITEARLVFDSEVEKDVALWNAMISGYAAHGLAKDAIALFEHLELYGIMPDHITFTSLLSACSRDGLVKEGWKYFNSMEGVYGIQPTLEHCTCMVGILGSAGLLEEALDFMGKMPYSPDACIWATLLRACRVHSNPEVGEKAANALFELEPGNASNYILLSNIYVTAGMWDSARSIRSVMKERNLMTINEYSSIDVGKTIYSFRGGDSSHSMLKEILKIWDKFANEMEDTGFFPLDPMFEDEEELDLFSCMHTEKLAICFGIISLNPRRPIRISKYVRMCIDCHTSVKHISKIGDREIFVRDVCFYHHFKDGICSCQDRW